MQERWLEQDAEFMRSTPMRAADTRKSGSKVEITVNATGRQSMSPPASPRQAGQGVALSTKALLSTQRTWYTAHQSAGSRQDQ